MCECIISYNYVRVCYERGYERVYCSQIECDSLIIVPQTGVLLLLVPADHRP